MPRSSSTNDYHQRHQRRLRSLFAHLSSAQMVPPLADDTAAFCAQLVAAGEGQPKSWELPIDAPRNSYRALMQAVGYPADAAVSAAEDLAVGSVPVRYYRPAGVKAADKLPVCMYMHGGGW